MKSKLKSCPFCKGKANLVTVTVSDYSMYQIEHVCALFTCPLVTGRYANKEVVINDWNKRRKNK